MKKHVIWKQKKRKLKLKLLTVRNFFSTKRWEKKEEVEWNFSSAFRQKS